jgi:hypothetical protein
MIFASAMRDSEEVFEKSKSPSLSAHGAQRGIVGRDNVHGDSMPAVRPGRAGFLHGRAKLERRLNIETVLCAKPLRRSEVKHEEKWI